MDLVLSTAIFCIFAFMAIKKLPTQITISPQILLQVVPPTTDKSTESLQDVEPMPREISDYISQESEPWAREDLLTEVHRLYAEHKDWSIVQSEMSGVS